MKILLYNPDNGVTRNFMPHLWMFLLQSLTPPGHEVVLVDGNARAMDDAELVRFVREQGVGLVGIGAMTRMIAKAYRGADAPRAARAPCPRGAAGPRRPPAARRRRRLGRGRRDLAPHRRGRRARGVEGGL